MQNRKLFCAGIDIKGTELAYFASALASRDPILCFEIATNFDISFDCKTQWTPRLKSSIQSALAGSSNMIASPSNEVE